MKKLLTMLWTSMFILSCTSEITNEEYRETKNEKDELQRLYTAAKLEGNELTVWGGGDAPDQLDWVKKEWEKDFPDIKINIRVDLSKFLEYVPSFFFSLVVNSISTNSRNFSTNTLFI